MQNTNTKYNYKIQIQNTNTKYKYKIQTQIQILNHFTHNWPHTSANSCVSIFFLCNLDMKEADKQGGFRGKFMQTITENIQIYKIQIQMCNTHKYFFSMLRYIFTVLITISFLALLFITQISSGSSVLHITEIITDI